MIPATERISSLVRAASLKFGVSERQRPIPPLAKPIRILIAAKYALMRCGLRVIFEQQSGWVVLGLRDAAIMGVRLCMMKKLVLSNFNELVATLSSPPAQLGADQ